jgi:hypothetical protein
MPAVLRKIHFSSLHSAPLKVLPVVTFVDICDPSPGMSFEGVLPRFHGGSNFAADGLCVYQIGILRGEFTTEARHLSAATNPKHKKK